MMSSLRSAVSLSIRHVLLRQKSVIVPMCSFSRLVRSLPPSISEARATNVDKRLLFAVTSRHIHTAGDKELAEFLKDEIQMEKRIQKSSGKLHKIKGFEVIGTDGPNVTLKKTLENESITVKFNVNNSVDDSSSSTEIDNQQEHQSQETKMVSKPAFQVVINKGGDRTLAIQCVFPPSDEYPSTEHEEGESYEDLIEIQDVALLNKSQEWTDDVYTLSASVMDGNLYDMLMKMLEERGVDADFVDQLIDFSTSYEHSQYVDALEKLKEFIDSK